MLAVPLVSASALPVGAGRAYRRGPRAEQLADEIARLTRTAPTLVVLDLAPVLGAQVAAALAERSCAHPVLHLGRWPYREALLPAAPLLASLICESRRLPVGLVAPDVAVVLDGERDRSAPGRSPLDRRVDNRYEMAEADLPDAPSLVAAGINRVLLASADSAERATFATAAERWYTIAGLAVERRIVT